MQFLGDARGLGFIASDEVDVRGGSIARKLSRGVVADSACAADENGDEAGGLIFEIGVVGADLAEGGRIVKPLSCMLVIKAG